MSTLPPLYVELRAMIGQFQAKIATARKELGALEEQNGIGATKMQKFGKIAGAVGMVGLGLMAAGAYKAIKAAADFQTQMGVVYSTTGEVKSRTLDLGQALLDLGSKVGNSGTDMAKAFYYVASGGFHGAAGLNVLKAAAEGAKIENSDLTEVTKAVTSAMAEYHVKASDATSVTSGMITAVGHGMMTFQDLAEALPNVGSRAFSANVSLQELLGGMATMTRTGLPASVAATYLGQTIGHLMAPSANAKKTMQGLGISWQQLDQTLSSGSGHGLIDAIGMLYKGITSHLTPSGLVAVQTFEKTKASAKSFHKMLAALPPNMQTVVGAIASMSGGVKGFQGTLMLGGKNLPIFASNVKAVGAAMKSHAKDVTGWADKQKTYNQQMDEAKAAFKNLEIEIGTDLLPVATKFIGWLASAGKWLERHKALVEIVAAALGGVFLAAIASVVGAFIAANAVALAVGAALALLGAGIIYLATHWSQTWTAIKNIVSSVGHWIGSFLSGIWRAISGEAKTMWNRLKSDLAQGWHAIAGVFSSAGRSIGHAVSSVWHGIENVTHTVWNAIAKFFKKWWPLLLAIFLPPVFLLWGLWAHTHKQIEAVCIVVWGAIKHYLGLAWGEIVAGAKLAWGLVKHYIVSPLEATWNFIVDIAKRIWHYISSTFHDIVTATELQWNEIKLRIANAWRDILTHVRNGVHAVAQWIRDKFNELVHWAEGWAKKWVAIGESIVKGIINGITNWAGHLFSSIGNLANNALSSAMSVLGINSPSKVFSRIVGRGIAEGIAHGVNAHGHLAVNAVGGLAKTVAGAWGDNLNFGGVGRGGLSLPGQGSYSSTQQPMILHLNVKGEVDGKAVFEIVQSESLRWGKSNSRSAFTVGPGAVLG